MHEWRVPQVHPRVLSEIQILTMTPMNVGKAKASQVAAIAGRKDAARALIISNDVALVPRGSLRRLYLAAAFQGEKRAHQVAWLRFMSKIKGSCGSHN